MLITVSSTDQPPVAERLLPRLARNVGWMLGGNGLTGVFSFFYLALAARALGPVQFGVFMVILTYGQLLANLVQFQSWKGVIRFGAVHLSAGRPDSLARLLGFCAVLDWLGAVTGAAIGAMGAFLLAPLFGWTAAMQEQAALFSAALLLTTGATATGMLRLFDRFDLLTYSEAWSPTVRLVGAAIIWVAKGGVGWFIVVWALAALAQALATWAAALLIRRARLSVSPASVGRAVRENPGLWRFMWQTSLSSSFGFLWLQAGTLAVGAAAGPAMAGGFRLADRVANAIAKPTDTVTRALYPELARLVASDDRDTLRSLFRRSLLVSCALAVVVMLVTASCGHLILRLIAGRQFEFAQPLLLFLALAAAVDIAGFILEPFHNAHGRSGQVLWARIVGTIVYGLALLFLLPAFGAVGAAIAAAITAAVIVGQLIWSARAIFRDPQEVRCLAAK